MRYFNTGGELPIHASRSHKSANCDQVGCLWPEQIPLRSDEAVRDDAIRAAFKNPLDWPPEETLGC